MSHNFESGVLVGQAAWHGLGTVVSEAPSIDDALKLAGIDWEVEQHPIYAKVPTADGQSFEYIEVPKRQANIRATDRTVLGDVSERYKPNQNRATIEAFKPLVESGDLKIETMGSLENGRKVWALFRYAESAEVSPGDKIDPFLLTAWGHDAMMALRLKNTPIRVLCMNTMRASGVVDGSMDESFEDKSNIVIAHVGDIDAKLRQAISAVTTARREFRRSIDVWRAMRGKPVDVQTVKHFAREIFDEDFTKAVALVAKLKRREREEDMVRQRLFDEKIAELEEFINQREEMPTWTERAIVRSFEEGPGHEAAGSTLWGLVNAVTHHIDHGRRPAGEKALSYSWFGDGAHARNKAFAMAEAELG